MSLSVRPSVLARLETVLEAAAAQAGPLQLCCPVRPAERELERTEHASLSLVLRMGRLTEQILGLMLISINIASN